MRNKSKFIFDNNAYQAILFILCLSAYTSSYLSRDTFSAVIPNILNLTGTTKTEIGAISTLFLICYGSGQLISGILGDKVKPHLLVCIGLFSSGIINILFALATNLTQMSIIWSLNGFALSLLWAPLSKILIVYMDDNHRNKAIVNISISMPLGTLTAFICSAIIVKQFDYKIAFYFVGIVILIMAIIWLLSTKKILSHLQVNSTLKKTNTENFRKYKFSKLFVMSGLFFIMLAIMCNSVIRNGISIWVPTFLTEKFNLEEFVSILTSTVIPIVNFGGIYVAYFLNKRAKNETISSAILFAFSAIALLILILIGGTSPFISIVFLGLTTAAMQGLTALIMGFVPLHFEKYNKSSTISGLLNVGAYISSSAGSFAVGIISTDFGWNATIFTWICVAIVGIVACLIVCTKWNRFSHLEDLN